MSTSIPLLGPALTEVAAHLSLSRSSYHLRQNTLTSIRNGARRIWPSAEVIVIGSFAQNLSLGDRSVSKQMSCEIQFKSDNKGAHIQ